MNALDYVVLLGTILGIAGYGVWRTRGKASLHTYLKGEKNTHWLLIGLSVMATQASAITFLSTPGQGYESGLSFVQNYFGAPLALIVISAVFLPLYRKLNVYTAYEFLGKRFDTKTRLLGALLFLLQRGLGAGITIYAPAIVLSAVFGWNLPVTIIGSGLVVTAYTVAGGSAAVTHTQKLQLGVIFVGMVAAFGILVYEVTRHVSLGEAFTLAGNLGKLNAVDFSADPKQRYTFWSGTLGGCFLALSYFGTDQSQVQRYLAGDNLRESRLGLMFNAVAKIPMQFFILLMGVFLCLFYQFEKPPVMFNQAAWAVTAKKEPEKAAALDREHDALFGSNRWGIEQLIEWKRHPETRVRTSESVLKTRELAENKEAALKVMAGQGAAKGKESDYIFITFILQKLPHGLIGLLVAAFFASTLSSKAGELNALASTTVIDVYRHLVRRDASDRHYVIASKVFTAGWGAVAVGFALFANFAENLIEATNILGSIFYGVVLGIFVAAMFLKFIQGTAVFVAAIVAQAAVFVMYATLPISYLWYNVIGCLLCILLAMVIQLLIGSGRGGQGFPIEPVGGES